MKSTIRRIVAACLSTAILATASMPSMAQNSHTLPYVLPASNAALTGFVRIINNSGQAGTVSITVIDDTGEWFGPITLNLESNETVNFNSRDLEQGNAAKGLSGGAGDGSGSWRLILDTALNITPLAYIRTTDGFVTSMHDVAPEPESGSMRYRIVFFNPGANRNQVSRLRLINPGTSAARIVITGRDDAGMSAPGGSVSLSLPAGGARTLTAQTLETGGEGITGNLGDGAGKWRLTVSSNVDIQVMSLLQSPTGHLANLSTVSGVTLPTEPDICPDAAEFNRLTVGNELELSAGGESERYRFLEGNRFEQSVAVDGGQDTGVYKYRKTGPNTVEMWIVSTDSGSVGEQCDHNLTCTTPTSGTLRGICYTDSPPEVAADWEIVSSASNQ